MESEFVKSLETAMKEHKIGSNIQRIEGWEFALSQYLAEVKSIPFGWGTNDCCLFSANWVNQLIGIDYMAEFRDQYTNEEEALKIIEEHTNLVVELDSLLEPSAIPFARRGDIVMYKGALGICNGMHSYFMLEKGLFPIKTSRCSNAWKVGI